MRSEQTNKTSTRNFCDETERLIDEYLEGTISPKDKEIMENHVSKCMDCRRYLDETSSLKLSLGTLSGNYEYLNTSEKEELWKGVESRVDFDKQRSESQRSSGAGTRGKSTGFHFRYRYIYAAAALAVVAAVIFFAVRNLKFEGPVLKQQEAFGMPSYWKVSNITGTPYISNEAMAKLDSIRDGEYIITNDSSRAELFITDIGKVIVEPNTKLMIVKGEDGKNRISVEYGTIDADMQPVSNPVPVMLPSAIAMDNGSSYKLTVDQAGDGLFFVRSGKVEVISDKKQSVATAGTMLMTKKDKGVGTPFNAGSSPLLKKALFDFDFGNCDMTCVTTIVNAATDEDAITLVNMLPHVNNEYKDKLYNKAVVFAPPPPNVPRRDSIPYINEKEIEEWVEKIEVKVNENIEKNMKHLEKSLENLKVLETISMDSLEWVDHLDKHFKVKVRTHPGDFNFQFMPDSVNVYFDEKEFREEMEELQQELNKDDEERKAHFKFEMKEIQEDMKELQKELKEAELERNDELKKELEKAQIEVEKALKEANEHIRVNVNTGRDENGNVKVEVKTEKPETPGTPAPPSDDK